MEEPLLINEDLKTLNNYMFNTVDPESKGEVIFGDPRTNDIGTSLQNPTGNETDHLIENQ